MYTFVITSHIQNLLLENCLKVILTTTAPGKAVAAGQVARKETVEGRQYGGRQCWSRKQSGAGSLPHLVPATPTASGPCTPPSPHLHPHPSTPIRAPPLADSIPTVDPGHKHRRGWMEKSRGCSGGGNRQQLWLWPQTSIGARAKQQQLPAPPLPHAQFQEKGLLPHHHPMINEEKKKNNTNKPQSWNQASTEQHIIKIKR